MEKKSGSKQKHNKKEFLHFALQSITLSFFGNRVFEKIFFFLFFFYLSCIYIVYIFRIYWVNYPYSHVVSICNYILHFIPLWEWTWCHRVIYVRQDWIAWIVSSMEIHSRLQKTCDWSSGAHVKMHHDVTSILKMEWSLDLYEGNKGQLIWLLMTTERKNWVGRV